MTFLRRTNKHKDKGNRDMGKKSNIKEDKYWTVEDMVAYVITGKKPKV